MNLRTARMCRYGSISYAETHRERKVRETQVREGDFAKRRISRLKSKRPAWIRHSCDPLKS